MMSRVFLCLFFFMLFHTIYGQIPSLKELTKARKNLTEAQTLYSNQHIEYAKAAIELARLYYIDKEETTYNEGDSLALPALRIIRTKKGIKAPAYTNALKQLNTPRAKLLDASLDLEEAQRATGRSSALYAQKLLKLARFYISIDDYDGYFSTINAYQILANLPAEKAQPVYAYAKQYIDPVILTLAKRQVKLWQLLKSAPQSIAAADARIAFARSSIQYNDHSTVYTDMDTSYFHISTALDIYKEKLGKKDKKYQKAFATFTKDMQTFYPMEKNVLGKLQRHETANDQFIIDLRKFLKKVDNHTFLFYEVYDVFKWVKNDLKKHHGGTSNRYYIIVDAMQKSWELSEEEAAIEIQKGIVKQTLVEFGKLSKEYVDALILLGDKYKQDGNDNYAFQTYQKAFKRLDEIELNLPFEANQEENLFQKYVKKLSNPWNIYITNQHNLTIQEGIYGITSNEYLQSLFQAGWDYIRFGDLSDKGEDCYTKGLNNLNENNFMLSLKWLDLFFHKEPEFGATTFKYELPQKIPLVYLKKLLEFPLDSMIKQYGSNSWEYAQILELLADGYYYATNIPKSGDEALRLYQKILTIYKNKEGIEYSHLKLLERIVKNIEQESPWSVETNTYFFEELRKTYVYSKKDPKYFADYLSRYANWHYEGERIIASEPYYQQLITIYEKQPEKVQQSINYAQARYNLARVYRKTGRYNLAIDAYYKALKISKTSGHFNLVMRCFDDLGLLFYRRRKTEKALELFDKALVILELIEKYIPDQNRYDDFQTALQYVKIMRHIGRVHLDNGYLDLAASYYEKVKIFERDERSPLSFEKDVSLRSDLAYLAELRGDTTKAILYYKAAIRQLKDKDELAEVNIAFANFYKNLEQDSMAAIYFVNALNIDLQQIEVNYTNLSEKERLLFLDPISKRVNAFFNFVMSYPDTNLILMAFNAHLVIKGLALETSTNLQSICTATENIKLKSQCHKMQSLRKKLARSTALPLDVQDNLNAQIIELEKAIGHSSKDLRNIFGKNNKKLDFQQLQKILYAMETTDSLAVAIDFLVLKEIDDQGYEQAVYYASVVNSTSNSPIFIRLALEEELEDVLAPDIAPNTINYITDELESRYLYQLVWEPLLPHLKKAKRLYICPTGILSKIAFGTLRKSDYDRTRIMDQWSIHYYSSFRDLLTPQVNEQVNASSNVALVGGVKFTFTKEETQHLAHRFGISDMIVETALDKKQEVNAYSRGARGEDFTYLPGTLNEVHAISKLFPSDWVVQLLSDTMAIEENLAVITDNSPSILHIATHGYFFPTPPEEDEDLFENSKRSSSLEEKISRLSNPLLRSGLALGGINRVWKGGEEIDGLEDGILTALEVANMDLFKTKLVVLSACETGRGDIDNNEGIMGLRRAFKTAGAKQLIISLWKVPDKQTAELMQLFYKDYINGETAHKAFENAQHTMRKRYRNPYYWAAFLLIE